MLIRAYLGVSLDGFVATPDGNPATLGRGRAKTCTS